MSVQKIAVIGGGTMGSGIALTAATHGIGAAIVDTSDEQLQRAKKYHTSQIERAISKERMTQEEGDTAIANCSYFSTMEEAADAD